MKRILLIILLGLVLMPAALALEAEPPTVTSSITAGEIEEAQTEALDTEGLADALPEEAGETLDGLDVRDSLNFESGVEKLYKGIADNIGGILTGGLKSAGLILIIAILCSTVSAAFESGAKYALLAGVLAISAVSVFNINAFIGLGSKTLDDMNTFSKMLLPTLTAAATAGGAVTSAAAKYAATTLFLDILMTVSKNVVVPLIYAFTATSVAEAALGGDGLAGVSGLLKWLARPIMTIMMLLFITYLSLTGVISGAADAVTARALKTTISTVLPVVGGIISDAAETVLAGANILKNAVGIFGLLAVGGDVPVPFSAPSASTICCIRPPRASPARFPDARISKLVGAVGTAFGMMLGFVGRERPDALYLDHLSCEGRST
jgi:stage III sporulation protein AE